MKNNPRQSKIKRRNDDYKSDKKDYKKGENDASWYTRNSALVADAGKIAFTWPSGVPVDMGIDPATVDNIFKEQKVNVNGLTQAGKFMTPGVMALKYVPTYGATHTGFDPLNIAAQNIYAFVRHDNSGHSNYEPVDLMLYLLAMDNIYMLWRHLVRAYGAIRLFSQVNRNYPRVLLNAMGFDYEDICANLANFRYFLNNAVARIGAMVVPNVMPIFERHAWMSSLVFSDSDSMKGQLYLFRPDAFGIYNEKTSDRGGFLEARFFDGVRTVKEWCDLLDEMIGAVRASEDCGIMSGDILKSYGNNTVKLMNIGESFMTNVLYSKEVLGQIQNATILSSGAYANVPNTSTPAMLYQDKDANTLKSNFLVSLTTAQTSNKTKALVSLYAAKHIMVGLTESPTPEEVLVNSRLMVFASDFEVKNNALKYRLDSCGSEVVIEGAMYDTYNMEGLYSAGSWRMDSHRYVTYAPVVNSDTASVEEARTRAMSKRQAVLNYFNHHPAVWDAKIQSGSGSFIPDPNTPIEMNLYFDVDNYALVNAHDVAKMHETCLLSLLDVPLLGVQK